MKIIKQMFQEANGQFSSMRLFSLIALIIAAFLSFGDTEFNIIMIWLVAAFAPKSIQKFAEKP